MVTYWPRWLMSSRVLHLCSVSVLWEAQSENPVIFYRQNVVWETQFL